MIKKLLILVAWALVGVVVGMVLAMTGIAVFTDMTFGEFVRLLVSLNPGEVFAAAKGIGLAVNGSFVEHLGGFLERCGRHEARGLQCSAGDTLKYLLGGGGHSLAEGRFVYIIFMVVVVCVAGKSNFAG